LPFLPSARWQGTTKDTGFLPIAVPTAREAFGLWIFLAMSE
jgi:hypothetical protein